MRAYLTAEWGKAVARPYYRIYLAVMAGGGRGGRACSRAPSGSACPC